LAVNVKIEVTPLQTLHGNKLSFSTMLNSINANIEVDSNGEPIQTYYGDLLTFSTLLRSVNANIEADLSGALLQTYYGDILPLAELQIEIIESFNPTEMWIDTETDAGTREVTTFVRAGMYHEAISTDSAWEYNVVINGEVKHTGTVRHDKLEEITIPKTVFTDRTNNTSLNVGTKNPINDTIMVYNLEDDLEIKFKLLEVSPSQPFDGVHDEVLVRFKSINEMDILEIPNDITIETGYEIEINGSIYKTGKIAVTKEENFKVLTNNLNLGDNDMAIKKVGG
jgi:hypothetical protein